MEPAPLFPFLKKLSHFTDKDTHPTHSKVIKIHYSVTIKLTRSIFKNSHGATVWVFCSSVKSPLSLQLRSNFRLLRLLFKHHLVFQSFKTTVPIIRQYLSRLSPSKWHISPICSPRFVSSCPEPGILYYSSEVNVILTCIKFT